MEGSSPSPRSSPVPSRRPVEEAERPISFGQQADPTPAALLQSHRSEAFYRSRARNRSPYSRSHLRSYSAASSLSSQPMARAQSLPNPAAGASFSPSHSPVRSSSPLRSPAATRASPRRSFDDAYPQPTPPSFMEIESIAEDSELDFAPRPPPSPFSADTSPSAGTVPFAPSPIVSRSNSRRRPNSPLHSLIQSPASPVSPYVGVASTSASASPSTTPPPTGMQPPSSRFNESYPGAASPAGATPQLTLSMPTATSTSSVPSTPTSLRSRSPSISSLETIPDSPDAEEAAMEAFNIARLKAAADAAAAEGTGSDSDGEGGRRVRSSGGNGTRGAALAADTKNRKRWSVCGAERRGDFEMETIWED